MNVQILIKLLTDIKKNTPVLFIYGTKTLSISLDSNKEKRYTAINLKDHSHKTLKVWELVILLKSLPPTNLIYVETKKYRQQIFGLRIADGKIYLK